MKIIPLVLAVSCTLVSVVPALAWAQQADEMAELSLEQLSDIVITSVSRQEARLSSAPASVYIISASDIRRSGARSLPEALRLAPNLQVARVDARSWAISARGFNSVFTNKLLVLIDGRSVYSPLFSGVFWDIQDVLAADIARIEVISGPGATIWGANAVNGVINVITKEAADTQGGLAQATAGQHERGGALRYGGKLAGGGHYRAYAKFTEMDASETERGLLLRNDWRRSQAGVRADLPLGAAASLALSGDVYDGSLGQGVNGDIRVRGANLVSRYAARLGPGEDLRVHLIVDHSQRDQPGSIHERLTTLDLEAQHDLSVGRHKLSWGGGYRHGWDRIANGPATSAGFLPSDTDLHWGNLFAQDEITLADPVRLTAGVKFEHNNYTGLEVLPNLRLAFTPDERTLLWTSLSRTVRAPSRIDRDLYSPIQPIVINGVPRYAVAGGPQFDSETADVAELGYRSQASAALSWSATAFYSRYDRLRTLEPHSGAPSTFENLGRGRAHGLEMWARWQALPGWRLDGGAVVQRVRTSVRPGSRDSSGSSGLATNDPDQRLLLRSSLDLSERSQLDFTLRYVGRLPRPVVPSYHELDAQWLWMPRADIDIIVAGQNLLHRSHVEFGSAPGRSVFERTVLVRAAYRF
ncbi:MAG: TonB-dependent receptor plug domain-containing protein [Gammaproteobacteria bacterium]